jgi:predicted flap endonuclease-1-like 5' DNA nuclease
MAYLHQTLWLWIVAAAVLGIAVGWLSCRKLPVREGLGWLTWGIIAFFIGLLICAYLTLPGRLGLWFDTGMIFFFWYVFGCCIGCLLRSLLDPEPLTAAGATAVAKLTTWPESAALPDMAVPMPAPAPAPVPAAAPVVTGPALVKPYQWQAAKDAHSVTLTGYAPSAETRDRIVAAAKTAVTPLAVVDKLQLGSGAPAGLEGLTSAALGHLAKLDRGIASLIDTKYTLTGVAGTQANFDAVISAVKALPAGYSLAKADIVAPPAPVMAPAPKPAAAAPVAVKAPEPKAAPKIAGEDKVAGKRPGGLVTPRGGTADDLKLINGVGKQNEARLHGLGIWHFDQVASWTAQESLWVGSYLAFPGRIEREEWVKQAKVLAAGKETAFSKRVAKGLVATSKDDGTLGKANVAVVKPVRPVKGKPPAKAPKPKK